MENIEKDNRAYIAQRIFTVILILFSMGFIALFYFIALRRMNYSLALEWDEWGVLDGMRRVASGMALYAEPSKEFVPWPYTPLYYYLGAGLSHFLGVRFLTLRVLSLLATTGCLALIFQMVRRNTGDIFASWIACGLFAALYGRAGGWYDLGRVDMVYLFFLLAAIGSAQGGRVFWSAILFVIAYQTKQTTSVVAILVFASMFRQRKQLIMGLGIFLAGVGVSFWILNRLSKGWFSYYTFYLSSHQAWARSQFIDFLFRELIHPLGLVLALIALAATLYMSKRPKTPEKLNFIVWVTLGIGLSVFAARMHIGGAVNSMLPLYAWLCILCGWGLHLILKQIKTMPPALAPLLTSWVLCVCALQFFALMYEPTKLMPTTLQKQEADLVLRRIASIKGSVFVMHNELDAVSAGKPQTAGYWQIWEVFRGDNGPVAQKLKSDLIRAFKNHEYVGIVSDRPLADALPPNDKFSEDIREAAAQEYTIQTRLLSPSEADSFYNSTSDLKPEFLYLTH